MFVEPLVALAAAGAMALVGAIATDMWQATRTGIVGLFKRDGEIRGVAIEAQLDEDAATVVRAAPADIEQARQELVPVWQRRLTQLLHDHPDAETELRDLVTAVREGLPAEQRGWVQTNIAHGNSTVFAVQGGNLHYHQAPTGQVPPAAGDAARDR
jgi:hypothetical protein